MAITLFYCWQSDRDQKTCHYFIRDAMKDAIRRLAFDRTTTSSEIEEALPFPDVVLSSGTEGVPGTPKVADTIQKRIIACDVFVADVTHVNDYATADGREKMPRMAMY